MGRPTIIDVAKAAGVSKSTVSLVLQKSSAVSSKTRDDVRKAMVELGYVYNRAAANLRSAQVGLVGLVINDLKNPFFTEFATAMQMAISDAGYATVVANTDEDPALQARMIAAMIEHGVSGFIISPAYGEEEATFGQLERAGIPTMQVLRKVCPRTDLFPFASPDYVAGGRLAAKHLVESGARRIAFVGGIEGRSVTAERQSGYLQVLEENGMEPRVIHGRPTRSFGRECADKFIDNTDCDAAVCFNDLVALGVISGFASRGQLVGRDFRLVGFDDIEEAAQSFPPLSSVHCGIAQFGQEMAATLMAWLSLGAKPDPETQSPVQLIIRGSSLSS